MNYGHFLDSKTALQAELKQILEEETGVEYTDAQVFEIGKQLTDFFEILIYGKEDEDS